MSEVAEFNTVQTSTAKLVEVLNSRAIFYGTIAALYFKPLTQEQVNAMAKADFSAYADINERFSEGIKDMTHYLGKMNTGTRQELAVDFTSAFIGTKTFKGRTAVPYKSVFTSESGLLYQEGYQEVFATFKHEAVKKREGLDYPDDHLSFMCEFMALLSRRTAAALLENDLHKAQSNLETSLSFLNMHILSWFDDFTELSLLLLKTRFYKGVLKMTRGFFDFDVSTLEDLLDEIKGR